MRQPCACSGMQPTLSATCHVLSGCMNISAALGMQPPSLAYITDDVVCPCRHAYDAFLVVHGTDTMAYTASALSLMLVGESELLS
jgi:L-asparaginase/Glu-tRNA(Gln) amidotransferase subunit D